jgi:hypothetical protein
MRGENFVAHLDGLGGTPVCRGTPVAHHCFREISLTGSVSILKDDQPSEERNTCG